MPIRESQTQIRAYTVLDVPELALREQSPATQEAPSSDQLQTSDVGVGLAAYTACRTGWLVNSEVL